MFGLSCLGMMAWLLAAAAGSASGKASLHPLTVVTVTAGRPSEFQFQLSNVSSLPEGPMTFNVTNAGRFFHNFKICTAPVASGAANSCVGKATKFLKSGQSATLTVTLTRSGSYEYLDAIAGHAAFGMKGLVSVDVTSSPSLVAPTNTSSSAGQTAPPAGQAAPAPAIPLESLDQEQVPQSAASP